MILGISILFQLASAVLALRLIPRIGKRKAWVLISGAIFLMAFHHCILFTRAPSLEMLMTADWAAEWVSLITSVLMLAGVALLGPVFEAFARSSRKLQETEEKYCGIFEESGDGIFVRGPSGRFIDVNPAALDLFGYARDEMLGMRVSEICAGPEDTISFERATEQQVPGKSHEMRLRGKDGTEIYALITSSVMPGRDGAPSGYRSIVRDITLRKRMEEELRKNNEILSAVLTTSPVGISLVRERETCWANDAFCQVLGRTQDEMLGRNTLGFYLDVAEYERVGRELYRSGNGSDYGEVDTRLVRKDGRVLDCHLRSRSLDPADSSKGQIVAVMDISERKRVEDALRQSEGMFRALTETAASSVFIVQGDRFQYVNPAMEGLTGYSHDELLALEFWQVAHPDYQSVVRDRGYKRLLTKEGPSRYEIKILCKNGREKWVDFSATYIELAGKPGVLGTAFDITERKAVEEALRQSEERYRCFFHEDLAGAYISTVDGRLVACNPAFARIFGFPSIEDALRCNLRDIYPDSDGRDEFMALLAKEGKLEHHEKELRRIDKKPIHVIENSVGTFSDQGELIEIKGYLFDKTDMKELTEQLRQSQKMEAIGRLAGGIAHDFNNLLTAITGYAELLMAELEPRSPLLSRVEQIKRAGDRAALLTQQLLAFSRKQMLRPEVLDFNVVLADMEQMLRRLIGEDIELIMEPGDGPMRVKADRGQIEQVVMNLVVNARDAMPDGGMLTIEAKCVGLDQTYAHSHLVIQPGPYVMLAISDTGIGMDDETSSLIFEPFFTTKEPDKGTGLGLAMVYGIVKQSGGSIWVYSEVGRGTTFKIYLPRVMDQVERTMTEEPNPAALEGSETILLVEDDDGVRELLCEVLGSHGYVVLEAGNGQDAMQICGTYKDPIHMMITDVVMPRMNGCDLAARVTVSRPETKVVFMSGYTDRGVINHGVLQPGAEFLQKPFNVDTLIRKVRNILDSH